MSDAMPAPSANQRTINLTGAMVAIGLVLILGGGIWALIRIDMPQANHDILLVLITCVATNVSNIVQFFFGSSANAKAKDDAISSMATTTATLTAANNPPPPAVPLAPGEKVTVAAEPAPEQTP